MIANASSTANNANAGCPGTTRHASKMQYVFAYACIFVGFVVLVHECVIRRGGKKNKYAVLSINADGVDAATDEEGETWSDN
jgi:hypothetical protein